MAHYKDHVTNVKIVTQIMTWPYLTRDIKLKVYFQLFMKEKCMCLLQESILHHYKTAKTAFVNSCLEF